MEPKSPIPQFNREMPAPSHEVKADSERLTGPQQYERPVERVETGESLEGKSDAALAAASQAVSLPTPVQKVVEDTSNVTVVDDTPLVAGDDDLIEKEWVDKAKQIIERTKDDPYRREQEVARLQAEYLNKRYGKELNTPR